NYYNYQMFVPVPINMTQTYYLITDPYDVCPEGADEAFGKGTVEGWVSDADTGVFLENVEVFIGTDYDYSDAQGYYNLSTTRGTYKVFAFKTGYNNYVGNVTVIEGVIVEHNISMTIYEEITGTGSGVGTGVGPGVSDQTKSKSNDDIGPSFGPGIGPFLEKPENPGIDHFVSLEKLQKKLRIGNFFVETIMIYNFRKEAAQLTFKIIGNATQIMEMDKTSLVIEPNSVGNVTVTGFGREIGTYIGTFEVSGDFNDSIPINILVTDEDKLPVEALLIQLELLTNHPYAGDLFKFRMNLHNMLIEEMYNVSLKYRVRGVESETSNYSVELQEDNVQLLTALSLIKEFIIPKEWPKGDYLITIDAEYLDLYSQTSTIFTLYEPFYMQKILGIELWKILAALVIISFIVFAVILIRARINAKKRFHAKVEYKLLPKKGPRAAYVGKIAETENDTYFDIDKLTVHSIIAGSTGGGKSIAGQDIVEECLLRGISVIVFDPTAQWSGMLRKCTDSKMMSFYPRFHMNNKDAKAFNGNVQAIKNPRTKIELNNYMKPGEIQIFTLSTMTPKEIDIFVANTVRQIFKSNLQEFRGLKALMVYDEVHRLLPKFGGSGEGFIQIERACREFRKWGIGVVLISQVLADFVGQIKANINTEVQMKTRDEGDLKRIETKYGKEFVQALVKAPVGSGMVQNSAWNRGQPYYVTFRPIMHSVERLTDDELAQYNKYNEMVDDLAYQTDQLEKEGQDVFDLKLELKLSLDKIKSGSFNMVDIYLEGLKPRIEKIWKDIGKTPKKKQVELISEQEIQAELDKAKEEREKFEKQSASETKGEKKEEKKSVGFNDEVSPDKLLNLVNGMIVISLKGLYDEIAAIKKSDFEKHVNEEKNDFADWIRTALGNEKLAAVADKIITKEDFLAFLEAVKAGTGEKYTVKAPRESLPDTKGGKKDSKADEKPVEKPGEKKNKENKEGENPKAASEDNKDEENPIVIKDDKTEGDSAEEESPKKEEKTPAGKNEEQKNAVPDQITKPIAVPVEKPETESDTKEKEDPPKEKEIERKKAEKETIEEDEHEAPEEQIDTRPSNTMDYSAAVDPEHYFRLSDGRVIKNLKELGDLMSNISDDLFGAHVNDSKNYFASWIGFVYKDKDFESRMAICRSKEEIKKIVAEALKRRGSE
ncbi:MAG: DUF87 domain-containing protein, partial [Nanoarchaeota archaeon]|nr:DUF87 domain-containing protein [Nanoarchaeota archaeon]